MAKDARVVICDNRGKIDDTTSKQMVGRGSRARGQCIGTFVVYDPAFASLDMAAQSISDVVKARGKTKADDSHFILPGMLFAIENKRVAIKHIQLLAESPNGWKTTVSDANDLDRSLMLGDKFKQNAR